MSLATELQKIKNLRDSGSITREEYEASRNRLLEECVQKIESVHDRNPKAILGGRASNGSSPSAPTTQPSEETEPPVTILHNEPQVSQNRPAAYSEELDYSLVKPPTATSPAASTSCAVAEQEVESLPTAEQFAGSREFGAPRAKFSPPPSIEEPVPSFLKEPERPAEIFQTEASETPASATPAFNIPAPPALLEPPTNVAYETVKFVPPAKREESRQHVSQQAYVHQIEFSAPDDAEELDLSLVANVHVAPTFPGVKADATTEEELPIHAGSIGFDFNETAAETEDGTVALEAEEAIAPAASEFVPRFAALNESKPKSKPVEKGRWGLPRFKLMTGEVQDVRLSMCQGSDAYGATVTMDGQRLEVTSSSEIRIAAGDRVTFGGYERDGQLLVLGYRNETSGSHSDLRRLRRRYRLLLTVGRLSLLLGLAVVAAAVMLFLHKPLWATYLARWSYVPYVLVGVAGAAISYLGLALSFVGRWAKEFHTALAPPASKLVTGNPPSALPATY